MNSTSNASLRSPIRSVSKLAFVLGVKKRQLLEISENSAEYWKPGASFRKADSNEIRVTHDAKKPLKDIHEAIKNRILKTRAYPSYMLGGISDPINPRGCKQHAAIHCDKRILISEDIANFFPNTTTKRVYRIWLYEFHCSPVVAEILTNLTTYDGHLPQGWKASSYLANLTLGNLETELVEHFQSRGYAYSRFVDDITVSSAHEISDKEKSAIISGIYKLLGHRGYRAKRRKHAIATRCTAQNVTGLSVNQKTPRLPRKKQQNVRAALFQLDRAFHERFLATKDYEKLWQSVRGHVGQVSAYNKTRGHKMRTKLNQLRPSKFTQKAS